MPYYVYMLLGYRKGKSVSYVGYTSALKRRLLEHNTSKGAKFTKGSLWKIIYYKKYNSKIISELKDLKVKIKFISDGDVSGALLVTDEKYSVDIFLGIGGGPEGVLAAAALDAFDCSFQGRFLFETDTAIQRAKEMGIRNLDKKYELNEIIKGDSIFCATGITTGDLVSGIKVEEDKFISETLVTHKHSHLKKVVKLNQKFIR